MLNSNMALSAPSDSPLTTSMGGREHSGTPGINQKDSSDGSSSSSDSDDSSDDSDDDMPVAPAHSKPLELVGGQPATGKAPAKKRVRNPGATGASRKRQRDGPRPGSGGPGVKVQVRASAQMPRCLCWCFFGRTHAHAHAGRAY